MHIDEILPHLGTPPEFWAHEKKIFDNNIIGLVLANFDGRILKTNPYFANLLGYGVEELEGKSILDLTTPSSHAATAEAMNRIKAEGFVGPYEKEFLNKDGSAVPVLVGGVESNGMILRYVLDNSARVKDRIALAEAKTRLEENVQKRTKALVKANCELSRLARQAEITAERARQSQRFLDSVIENIPNLIFVKCAKDLTYVSLNQAVEKMVGKSRSEILGKTDFEIFPPELANAFRERDMEVLNLRQPIQMFEEQVHIDGEIRYLQTRKLPILDSKGEPKYLLGIADDITERKLSEAQKIELAQAKAAREAAEKTARRVSFLSEASAALNQSLDLRSLLNSFARVVVRHMADWCIVDLYNEEDSSIERLVAVSRRGHIPTEVIDWWSRRKVDLDAKDGLGYVLRTGKARVYSELTKEKLVASFGNEYLADRILNWGVRSSVVVPLSYYGRTIGALSFISLQSDFNYDEFDVSVAQDLAKRASLAIENARLYSQASEANRAKSAFLANISHEIRTPLGAMLGFAEIALDDPSLNTQQRTFISTIARNGRQLLSLVDEILDLSKVESERISIEKISFSLPALLHEVYALLKVKADERGLEFRFEGIDSLPEKVESDPLRIRQILINVVGNALKFTENGSIEVRASATRRHLEFRVKDTGIGLTDEQSSKIFQPFVQADGSMTRKFGGTGLGLFLARKLAHLLGGDVQLVRTSPGRGSEFLVRLAIEGPKPSEAPVIGSATSTISRSQVFPDDFNVLMVDDSEDNRTLIDAYLANTGVHLDLAGSGPDGIKMALNKPYDVILMDLQMPEMDGFAALRELKGKNYKSPVVALTAHAMKGDRERCLDAGFSDYLRKPVSRRSLTDCLLQYADSGHSAPVLH